MGAEHKPQEETPTPQAAPQQQVPLKVVDTKKFGINGLEKQTLQNYLDIRAINDFNLRAYLQMLGATRLGIQDGALVQFDLQLDTNFVEVRFLAPDDSASAPVIETAPPTPAQ